MNHEEEERIEPSVEDTIQQDPDSHQIKETERLEQLALSLSNIMPVHALPKQDYIQATVIPILLEGIAWIIKERPEDPVEALAMFLIKNNPATPHLNRTIDLSEFE